MVVIAGVSYRLRLSVSALAEMALVFEADSPKALAAGLRKATLTDWNDIFRAVATPPPVSTFGRDDIIGILPALSALMRDGLRA